MICAGGEKGKDACFVRIYLICFCILSNLFYYINITLSYNREILVDRFLVGQDEDG